MDLAPTWSACLDFSTGFGRTGIYDFDHYMITFTFDEVIASFGMRVSAYEFTDPGLSPTEITSRFDGSLVSPNEVCMPLLDDTCVVFRVEKNAPQSGAQFTGDIGVDVQWYIPVPPSLVDPKLLQAPGTQHEFSLNITSIFCPDDIGGEASGPGCGLPACYFTDADYDEEFDCGYVDATDVDAAFDPTNLPEDAGIRGTTDNFSDFTVTAAVVPEPGTLALLASGLVLGYRQWRRKRSA